MDDILIDSSDCIADILYNNNAEIILGEIYSVYRSNRTILDGKIVQWRQIATHSDDEINQQHQHLKTEYYVHYIDQNPRLDDWITPNQILGHRPSLGQYTQIDASSDTDRSNECTENRQIKQIEKLRFGKFEIDTWYQSSYAEEYADVNIIYVCQYCLNYMQCNALYMKHRRMCIVRQPPGNCIYRKGKISVYEIDGHTNYLYCQLLCLVGKFFMEHKTICYDVAPFLFYVLCEIKQNGAEFIGYFSKEKLNVTQEQHQSNNNNLATLMVLPPYQRCGYGRFLIEFSYELSKREGIIGGPERPLSDMATIAYNSYWTYTLIHLMNENIRQYDSSSMSLLIMDLSKITSIQTVDIVKTLQNMNMIKFWNGETIICATKKMLKKYSRKLSGKMPKLMFDSFYLKWNATQQFYE